MKQEDSITQLKGVGKKTAELFLKLGIVTIGDLLHAYPRDYDSYEPPVGVREARPGSLMAIWGQLTKGVSLVKRGALTLCTASLKDVHGNTFQAIWFNQPYLRNLFHTGEAYVFRGKVALRGKGIILEQPEHFTSEQYQKISGKMRPVYALTAGLSRNLFIKCVQQVLEGLPEVEYTEGLCIPRAVMPGGEYMPYTEAVRTIHFPKTYRDYLRARESLAYTEFFCFALKLAGMKQSYGGVPNAYGITKRPEVDELAKSLPYELTRAQKQVWSQMRADLTGGHTMHRLVQGDVGSGKTILAFLAMYEVALCGYQAFMMAPTEVLAMQHYHALQKLFTEHNIDISVELLTGSLRPSQKQELRERIAGGQVSIVIGTHAVIQETVQAKSLALVITDEQHRFGVYQRESLTQKGLHPHVCVMSATPIPRTLAMILYGDLDLSVLDEKPANRLPIKNCVIETSERYKAYRFIMRQVELGHQAYVICPMVEESELMQGENVIDYAQKLKEVLSANIRIDILHGRMSSLQKQEIMERFQNGDIQVLVSTVVVEVGVDVPNATVMVIEDAQRFGLAQLHQLRGRVGRGDAQSYCIFIQTSGDAGENARLSVLSESNDGFHIAAQDLQQRGAGELSGIRQSGDMGFAVGDLYRDSELLTKAVGDAHTYWSALSEAEKTHWLHDLALEQVVM